jgi:hypothetical protein
MKVVGISSPCRYTAPCADKGKLRSKTKLSNKFLILSPPYYLDVFLVDIVSKWLNLGAKNKNPSVGGLFDFIKVFLSDL